MTLDSSRRPPRNCPPAASSAPTFSCRTSRPAHANVGLGSSTLRADTRAWWCARVGLWHPGPYASKKPTTCWCRRGAPLAPGTRRRHRAVVGISIAEHRRGHVCLYRRTDRPPGSRDTGEGTTLESPSLMPWPKDGIPHVSHGYTGVGCRAVVRTPVHRALRTLRPSAASARIRCRPNAREWITFLCRRVEARGLADDERVTDHRTPCTAPGTRATRSSTMCSRACRSMKSSAARIGRDRYAA